MNKTKISVIVPVYNAELYLSECLDSLLLQTFTEFEIICVNDGSTDNSLQILECYAKKDKRIKIINQDNQKTAIARKNAITHAQANYLAFVDADDWIDSNYLQKMYNTIIKDNTDIVYCGYIKHKNNKIKIKKKTDIKTIYPFNNKDRVFYRNGQAKIAKKSLFKKIIFPTKCSYGEDSCISMQLSLQKANVSKLNEALYHYRVHKDSTIQNKSFIKNLMQLINAYIALETFVNSNPDKKINLNFIRNKWFITSICNLIKECKND